MPKPKKHKRVLRFKTVFVSDIHLGTADSKVTQVIHFLRNVRCEKLVLNGDIIDGWALKRGSKWKKSHTRFIRTVLKMMEKKGVEVIYLRGNHDDILDRFLPIAFGKMRFVKEFVHEAGNGRRYLVVHGDGFDSVSTNYKWLASLGAVGYDVLLKINRAYNNYRLWRGKEEFSLSKKIKGKVKSAVSFVDNYQQQLQIFAQKRGCDGIICGHIHTPADEMINGVHYLNSGDWVESLSCVVEHQDGKFEVLYYEEFLRRVNGLKENAKREAVPVPKPGVEQVAGSRPVNGDLIVPN